MYGIDVQKNQNSLKSSVYIIQKKGVQNILHAFHEPSDCQADYGFSEEEDSSAGASEEEDSTGASEEEDSSTFS